MPKMNLTQQKRAYRAIKQKARKLWGSYNALGQPLLSTQDLIAIEKIIDKYLKKF